MRKIPLLFLLLSLLLGSYYYEPHEYESGYEPIVMTRDQLKKSIKFIGKKALVNPGKIYLKGNYIFIVENFEGIHIVDNNDRANPIKVGFIQVPGCVDLAIKGTYMYVDNAVDLVTLDIGDLPNVQETNRITNVFPELVPPDTEFMPSKYSIDNRPGGTVIIAWIPKN